MLIVTDSSCTTIVLQVSQMGRIARFLCWVDNVPSQHTKRPYNQNSVKLTEIIKNY